jgi:hypothetical protein
MAGMTCDTDIDRKRARDADIARRRMTILDAGVPFDELSDFEWAVIDQALDECEIGLNKNGVFLSYEDTDPFDHNWDDMVEHTLNLINVDVDCASRNSELFERTRSEMLIERRRIAAALRVIADRIEQVP